MKVLIPRDTLHKEIHHNIRTIPLPTAKDAKHMFSLLVAMEYHDELDPNADLIARLNLLIAHMTTPDTVEALKKQRDIVSNFYSRESS